MAAKRKYKFTGKTMVHEGHVLHQIMAIRDINNRCTVIPIHTIGGWIESMDNLAQLGECWVTEDSMVYDDATVLGGAFVRGKSIVCDKAQVYGTCIVIDTVVQDQAQVYGDCFVQNCVVSDCYIHGECFIRDSDCRGTCAILDCCNIQNSKIHGNVYLSGCATIKNADIERSEDFIVMKNCWSSLRYFTYTFKERKWTIGCFYGNHKELLAKARCDSPIKYRYYKASVDYVRTLEKLRKELKKKKRKTNE